MVTEPRKRFTGDTAIVNALIKQLSLHTGITVLFFALLVGLDYFFGLSDQLVMPIAIDVFIAAFLMVWITGGILIFWRLWTKKQNDQVWAEEDLSKDELRRAIQSRYQKRFWVSFALYSIIMILIIVVFFAIKDSRIWYDYDPWYNLLAILRTLFPFVLALLWAGGAFVLLFTQWRQNAADIVGLVDSIKQMQTEPEGGIIAVPHTLQELQPVLQNIYDESSENRRVAQETEQRKNDLILYLAHDLKTPLTSVIGYLSLIEDSDDLTEKQRVEYTKIARQKALRLEELIDQFFEISRFNMLDFELEKTRISLNVLLAQLADEFYPLAEEKGKAIKLTTAEDIVLYGDADRLARVFNNVLKNALAYSSPESVIEISVQNTDESIVVSITNEGTDIPPDQLAEVFNKFYRLDEARASNSGGAGLGLAIAKEIIERHGGTITAESQNGETRFSITLPKQ